MITTLEQSAWGFLMCTAKIQRAKFVPGRELLGWCEKSTEPGVKTGFDSVSSFVKL